MVVLVVWSVKVQKRISADIFKALTFMSLFGTKQRHPRSWRWKFDPTQLLVVSSSPALAPNFPLQPLTPQLLHVRVHPRVPLRGSVQVNWGAMDKDFKDVGSGDDTSECYIITISESRRRIAWCAVLLVCVCGECVVRVWLCGVLLCGRVCDDTSECYIITISKRRRRIVWCAVLVVCVCCECVVRVWLFGVLLCGRVCCCCWYVCVWCCVLWCAATSPHCDEFLKHFGERQPQELVCWWTRTTTRNKDSDDSLCRHLRLECQC